jgi:hypothetical protein
MNDVKKYYSTLVQEVSARQLSNEDGDTQEQSFTQLALDMLSDSGDTENAQTAFDEKGLGTKNQHKINAYAIADNYETIDLFISIYTPESEIPTISKSEIDRAVTRITNFFRKVVYNDYANEIAESSQIFEFANTLANYSELRENLIRVNAFVLTNGEYNGDLPPQTDISGYKFFYRVIDINYLYQISEDSKVPIEINFEEEKYEVPCLCAGNQNEDYQSYIAIIPGQCLASLYERYGARLLEQNVRSFLQFTGKINKGIRKTINEEPHMFLAYNNGIAATADNIELDSTGHFIKKINNLQIVNGGQTTASIYHTAKKDKADISEIFVQVKFSVVKKKEQFSEIVSSISHYANTQNKVNDADFTANNPYLIALEKLSRHILSPITAEKTIQTFWFFERARGQYKNLRQKEGFRKSRQKNFDIKYPKNQVFTKVELAKYINAYCEVFDGKKLAIGPHIVVRGNEKNYAKFINNNLPDNIKKINNVYFEDAVAKTILFRTADKLYGTKKSGNHIGELKQVVVPYTISLLYIITGGKLNLYKIWLEQKISSELSDFIYNLMKQVNEFILKESPVTHYIEWSKKEECWQKVKENEWAYNINDIVKDLIDENNPPKRKIISDEIDGNEDFEHEMEIIRSIPSDLWKKIADWGQDSGFLNINSQTAARDIAHKLKFNHKITDSDRKRGMFIYETVCTNNIELLEEADSLAQEESVPTEPKVKSLQQQTDISLDLVQKMVDWDRRKHILEDWKWRTMNEVVSGKKELTDKMKYAFKLNYEKLKKAGFEG